MLAFKPQLPQAAESEAMDEIDRLSRHLCAQVEMIGRRFTPPWDVDDSDSCFILRDANGQALPHVYYENEPAGVPLLAC